MSRVTSREALGLALVALLGACGGASGEDAGLVDGGLEDASLEDADVSSEDASASDGAAGDDSAAASDGGPRSSAAVVVTIGANDASLEHAYLGYERTDGAITGLYVEVHHGDTGTCPTMTSPTAAHTLTVSGIASVTPGTSMVGSGLTIGLFDFEGSLLSDPRPVRATAGSVTLSAIDLEGGVAEGRVDATFDGGSAVGPFTAVHCDSLDGS